MERCFDGGIVILDGSPVARVRESLQKQWGSSASAEGGPLTVDLSALMSRLGRVRKRGGALRSVELSPHLSAAVSAARGGGGELSLVARDREGV